jgi:hypothetical protein
MTLTADQKKKLDDLAIGEIVTGQISTDAQTAAIRKQLLLVSAALEIPLDKDFQALVDLVESEKKKKEKAAPAKSKKTTKKSG